MLFTLIGFAIAFIAVLTILTGLAFVFNWPRAGNDQVRLLLGGLLGGLILLLTLLYILWH